MGRFVAIDYGTRRCGIAVSDPTAMYVSPLVTVASHELMNYLAGYMESEQVTCLVVGKPLRMNGEPSDAFIHAQRFLQAFKKRFPEVRTDWMDERYTSKMAVQQMAEAGFSKKSRRDKGRIDKMSAALILKSYLDMERPSGS